MLEDFLPIERIKQLSPTERAAILAGSSCENFMAFMRRILPLEVNRALTDDQLHVLFGEFRARVAEGAAPEWCSQFTGRA